jgi:hypothetical protein
LANQHRYGLRWVRSLSGAEQPQILRFPVASAYQASTGSNVNLNTGDPIYIGEDGCVKLTAAGADTTTANGDPDEYIFGVIAGFERTYSQSQGLVEQKSYLAGGTTYTGGIGGDNAPLALVIPAAGNIFEIDADAVLGTPTKSGALAMVGKPAVMVYDRIASGVAGAPKANPLLDEDSLANTVQGQLLIVGLGAKGDAMDFTAPGVTFQVMVNAVAMQPHPLASIYGADEGT